MNCAVELARLSNQRTLIVDLKPGLGEVGLFLGVRSRYTLVDALDNMNRLDAEFLRELVAEAQVRPRDPGRVRQLRSAKLRQTVRPSKRSSGTCARNTSTS